MTVQEGKAGCGFFGRGIAVLRRTPIEHVRDVDLFSIEPDRGEHEIQELARAADEGNSLLVLVSAGRLSDQHDPAQRRSVGKDRIGGVTLELATLEIMKRAPELR